MKCQKCNKNQATTHITQVINGNKTEMYLCRECSEENQDILFFKPGFDQEFENLFSGFWNNPQLLATSLTGKNNLETCSVCKMTASEFLRKGKPGCSNCYSVFSDYLLRPLKQIHGSTHHTGKIPSRKTKDIKSADQLKKLEQELNLAVMDQKFEEAAVIRDKINELRSQH